jgi:UV DNA damage endonuclease
MELADTGISTNRGMIKKTFLSKGKDYAADLALQNLKDLLTILKWNTSKGIKLFRMSSCLFPWMSEYEFKDLYNYEEILSACKEIGKYVKDNNQRLGFHPGHFDILASPSESVIANTVLDLNRHSQIMDMMDLDINWYNTINIHVGGAYGNKEESLARFCKNFMLLEENTRKRLTVENDDKDSMYSVKDLYNHVYSEIKIPIIFDYHHHRINTGGLSEYEALILAYSTWPESIKPILHYSSAKKLHEDDSVKIQAHADFIYEKISTYELDLDIELEAKAKEKALLSYTDTHLLK